MAYLFLIVGAALNGLGNLWLANGVGQSKPNTLVVGLILFGLGFVGYVWSLRSIALPVALPTYVTISVLVASLGSLFGGQKAWSVELGLGLLLALLAVYLLARAA